MAFLDFNAAEGAPLHSFVRRPAPAPRAWLHPRSSSRRRLPWRRAGFVLAALTSAIAAPSAYASDYFDDPLLGLLAAALLYATSAPIAAWLVGGDRAAVRADHTKI